MINFSFECLLEHWADIALVIREAVETKQLKNCLWSPLGCGITGDCVAAALQCFLFSYTFYFERVMLSDPKEKRTNVTKSQTRTISYECEL